MNDRFHFITGAKRSATHYLNRLFDGHPELGNTLTESYLFEYYAHGGKEMEAHIVRWLKSAPVTEVYADISRRQLLPAFAHRNIYDSAYPEESAYSMDFDSDTFCERLEESRGQVGSMRELVSAWVEVLGTFPPWAAMTNRKQWVFKCADFGETLRGAQELDLVDRAVFLIRDPLGIARSLKKRREQESHRSFHVFELLDICRALEKIPSLLEDSGDKVLLVRFEELTTTPRTSLEEICAFWGVGWNDCLLEPTLLGRPWAINTSFSGPPASADILTDTERSILRERTIGYSERFGYTV